MGFGDGVFQGMQDADLYRAQASESRARANAKNSARDAAAVSALNKVLEDKLVSLSRVADERTALASSALVVINAMVETLETLPPEMRERFRETLARRAREKMVEIDRDKKLQGADSLVIAFKARPQNAVLGIH